MEKLRMIDGLYLDDYRTPRALTEFKHERLEIHGIIDWKVVRSYEEFVENIITDGVPEIVSFDHDLAIEHVKDFFKNAGKPSDEMKINYDKYKEKTGYQALLWLIRHCEEHGLDLPLCTVHSANPAGSDNIVHYINNYLKHKGVDLWHAYKTIW